MERVKCANPECSMTLEDETERTFTYCSIECAVYDGVFSVRTGWKKEELEKRRQGHRQAG